MSVYIARSALATYLLDRAQEHEPQINGLWVEFVGDKTIPGNWFVSQIEVGLASTFAAQAAIHAVVSEASTYIMVEDGDPRDGQTAPSPTEREKGMKASS